MSLMKVSEVMKLCHKYDIPVVPYGGATSFEGHILAPTGGVSLDMCNLKKILRVSEEDLDATVQPGKTTGMMKRFFIMVVTAILIDICCE